VYCLSSRWRDVLALQLGFGLFDPASLCAFGRNCFNTSCSPASVPLRACKQFTGTRLYAVGQKHGRSTSSLLVLGRVLAACGRQTFPSNFQKNVECRKTYRQLAYKETIDDRQVSKTTSTNTTKPTASLTLSLMGTLKPHSNGPLYSKMVIDTAVVWWAVTFGTARRPLLAVPNVTVYITVYHLHIIRCRTIIAFAL